MDEYRSDGEVGVQLYFACTAMRPALQKWGNVESQYQKIKQKLIVTTVSGWLISGQSDG